MAIRCLNLNSDSSFHHELNLSSIEHPSNGMQTIHGVVEIRDQNLCGSESNIDCLYEGENMRPIVIPQSRVIEVRDQNLHGSESNIDRRPLITPRSKIVSVQDQNVYCS